MPKEPKNQLEERYLLKIEVVRDTTNGTLCEVVSSSEMSGYQDFHEEYIVVRDYPNLDELVSDHYLTAFRALPVGRIQTLEGTLTLYDCGRVWTVPPPKPLTPEQMAAAKAKSDAAKEAGVERALKWNEDQAAKGDPYGLLRMGERYRDGNGVEKDLSKAREYFTSAAAGGSAEASNALSHLR